MGDECPDTLVIVGFLPRALVAQRIEQKTSNLLVAGSIPAEGADKNPENPTIGADFSEFVQSLMLHLIPMRQIISH